MKCCNDIKPRILVIGGLPDDRKKCQYGGATILMKNFIDYLNSAGIPYRFIQTNRFTDSNGKKRELLNKLYLCTLYLALLPFYDKVMFNFSNASTVSNFPLLSRWSLLWKKKIILRKFGGSLDIYLKPLDDTIVKRCAKYLSYADLVFVETKSAVVHMQSFVTVPERVKWFPNVRKPAPRVKSSYEMNGRIAFMSHIADEKGVADILKIVREMPDGYVFDFYGAIKDAGYRDYDFKAAGVNYCGEISSAEVMELLPDYQYLLLPSYREGYPGIVLEAMSVGVPVIATNVGGIPEIIDNGYNGIMIEPGDTEALKCAILNTDAEQYASMSENAAVTFNERFNSDVVNKRILMEILNV